MKQERTKKKVNGLLVFSICLLIVALLTPLTFALFTDLKTSKTEITFGKIQIDAGKTRVDTNIANLLPSSAVFEDKVVVAKDVFSESYILRAKHSFASTTQGIDEYLGILGGNSFQKKDAQGHLIWEDNKWYSVADDAYTQLYIQTPNSDPATYEEATTENVADINNATFYTTTDGTSYTEATSVEAVRKPDMANGFILTTQAVDESGNVWASVYNATNGTYTVTAVDANGDSTQDTIAADSGYATDYQWYYHDGYFYLCEYFGTDTTDVNIKEVTKGSYADTVNVAGTDYDLTDKDDRDALITYFDETLTVTVPTNNATRSLKSFKGAVDAAKESYTNAMSAFKTSQTAFNTAYSTVVAESANLTADADTTYHASVIAYLNGTSATVPTTPATGLDAYNTAVTTALSAKTDRDDKYGALDTNLTVYRTAITQYSEARDLVAAEMKDYQQLYVFALGGEDYNTIPYDLYQLDNYAQYSAEFTLSLQFDAVQSENLRASGATEDLVLADTAIADLVGFFPTSNN